VARTKEEKAESKTLMEQTQANRNYKSSVFADLMGIKEAAREAYYALKNVWLPEDTPVEVITLSDVLYLGQLNDVAFKIGDVVILLLEHQSSQSPNVPIRIFIYLGREYEKVLASLNKELYSSTLVQIPRPEFYVLYNGETPLKDSDGNIADIITYKLSDMFLDAEGARAFPGKIELEVPVYNINHGHNTEILDRSERLRGFAQLVAKTREYQAQANPLEEAIKLAIEYCIENDVLKEYLVERGAEVRGMLFEQFTAEDLKDVWYNDGKTDDAKRMLEDGVDFERVSKWTGLPIEKIKAIKMPRKQPLDSAAQN